MNIGSRYLSITVAILMVFLVSVYGINQFNKGGDTEFVEITEYQGVKLSSVNDFRENSIRGPQEVNVSDYKLEILGLVEKPIEYTYHQVLVDFKSHKKVVTLNCVEGWSATVLWEGIKVMDLVEASNPMDDAKIIIFHGKDGYTTSLPIDYIKNNELILAYKINDITLPEENGFPFQLVAESKLGYKWCRWVTALEFSDDAEYEGYWESRGYSNSADLDKPSWGD